MNFFVLIRTLSFKKGELRSRITPTFLQVHQRKVCFKKADNNRIARGRGNGRNWERWDNQQTILQAQDASINRKRLTVMKGCHLQEQSK